MTSQTRRAVIVHGKPSKAKYESDSYPGPTKANWLPWVGERLLEIGYDEVAIPEIPTPYEPSYDKWVDVLRSYRIDKDTLVIGHSFGAAALVEYIGRHPAVRLEQFIAVAPWFDPQHRYVEAGPPHIDPNMQHRTTHGIDIFYGSTDSDEVLASVKALRAALPSARLHDIPEYGHFMYGNSMESVEFPELIEVLGADIVVDDTN
jgi:predicted alpha/beta hydrolase family esterase